MMQLQWGLRHRLIPVDTWDEDVTAFAARLAALPTKAIGLIKRSLKATSVLSFEDYLEQEAQGQRIAGLTKDHREGVTRIYGKKKTCLFRTIGGVNTDDNNSRTNNRTRIDEA